MRLLVVVVAACSGGGETSTLECGAGTIEEAGVCVPAPSCGAGTHDEGGTCVLDARFEIRTASTIRADGWTAVEVRVVGTNAGSPIHDDVVVSLDRASAGTVVSPRFRLGDRGGATNLVPCTSTEPMCAGPARLSVALASAPQSELAHVDFTLVAPPPIGSITPCLVGGNVLHLEAQQFGFTGTRTITTSGFFDVFGAANRGVVHVVADNESYSLELNTRQLNTPLLRSVYEDANVIGLAAPGQPVFDTGFRPCSPTSVAAFQIHSFTYDAALDDVTQITASFTEHCPDTDPLRIITGCVTFSQ